MPFPDPDVEKKPQPPRSSGTARLVCGCGYLGERVARRWLAAGHEVWVTTRSPIRAETLNQLGCHPLVIDITRPFHFPGDLPNFGTVLSAVGFDRRAGDSIHEVYVKGLGHLLDALPVGLSRFIYISSTGVYGQSHGEWVDERSPCEPTRAGGRACLAAEQLLATHAVGGGRIILRLAGIYGPGRLPKLAAILAGEAIETAPHGFLNLIHVEDAADVVLAVEQQVTPPALFIVADGHPVLREEFYTELARLLNAPTPRFMTPAERSSSAERALADKRVCSDFLRKTLEISLRFPSFREGLAQVAEMASLGM